MKEIRRAWEATSQANTRSKNAQRKESPHICLYIQEIKTKI